MTNQLGFYVDLNSCIGCKTCQIACKDKNNLPIGVLWRRVYEISGGAWVKRDLVWETTAFGYAVSLSCNHCEEPICLEVCPADAISKRPDGVVLIDDSRCLGCRYCQWVCPYGAPQFNEEMGRMTKCNFCSDYLDEGKPPACVAACPMRVLDYGPLDELQAKYGDVNDIYPLPEPSYTHPSLVLTPNKDSQRARTEPVHIDNPEEV
jgi:anaerobic dimethyl sulfoxide reductase subunit B (iron-sulfur subunit)